MLALVCMALSPVAAAQELKIEILEGDGAVLNIRERQTPGPRVRVTDTNQQPLAGVAVTFRLPEAGPSARFDDGRILTLTTDSRGEAVARGLRPNSQLGLWEIRVSAAYQGRVARAVIQQTNAAPVEAFAASGKRSRTLYLLAAVGAGVAAATSLGVARTGGSMVRASGVSAVSSPAGALPPLAITPGSGSISAP